MTFGKLIVKSYNEEKVKILILVLIGIVNVNVVIKYCKNKHIPLIIIPYNDYEIIDENYLKNKIMEVYTL